MEPTKNSSDFAKEFSEAHPEIGELKQGDVLTPESISTLRGVLLEKFRKIERRVLDSRQTELTPMERSFTATSTEMLVRTAEYLVIKDPTLVHDEKVSSKLNGIFKQVRPLSHYNPKAADSLKDYTPNQSSARDMESSLSATRAIASSIPSDQFRGAFTKLNDMSIEALEAISAISNVRDGGLPVDEYMSGNLQNVLAHYELLDEENMSES